MRRGRERGIIGLLLVGHSLKVISIVTNGSIPLSWAGQASNRTQRCGEGGYRKRERRDDTHHMVWIDDDCRCPCPLSRGVRTGGEWTESREARERREPRRVKRRVVKIRVFKRRKNSTGISLSFCLWRLLGLRVKGCPAQYSRAFSARIVKPQTGHRLVLGSRGLWRHAGRLFAKQRASF